MTLTLVIARVVLAVVFLMAGVAKLCDQAGSRHERGWQLRRPLQEQENYGIYSGGRNPRVESQSRNGFVN